MTVGGKVDEGKSQTEPDKTGLKVLMVCDETRQGVKVAMGDEFYLENPLRAKCCFCPCKC
jgi:hypothetical protein